MKTIKLYEFSELSEEAKETAIEDFRNSGWNEYMDGDDNRKSLEEFIKIFPVKVRDWSYGGSRQDGIEFSITEESEDILNLSGLRLSKYLWNNYKNQIYKGKYYSRMIKLEGATEPPYYKYKYRHSKCILEQNANLTGFHMDFALLQPIYTAIDSPNNATFEDLLSECLNNWVKVCTEDAEDQNSDESIQNLIEANEYSFTAKGKLYRD